MNALSIEETAIMGHSMGAVIALSVAARWPDRIERAVLVSAAAGLTNRTVLSNLWPLVRTGRYMAPAFLPTLAYDSMRAGPLTIVRAARQLFSAELQSQVHAPTLLIHGDCDTLVPLALAERLQAQLPNARLRVIAGAGHIPMFERPREFNNMVLRFLGGGDPEL
jgi:pimeloyl-ACP methyl ester carboxylesterase